VRWTVTHRIRAQTGDTDSGLAETQAGRQRAQALISALICFVRTRGPRLEGAGVGLSSAGVERKPGRVIAASIGEAVLVAFRSLDEL